MTVTRQPERLSAKKFIEKVENASSYAIIMNEVHGELELLVKEDGDLKGYFGPDPIKTKAGAMVKFLERLEVLVKQDTSAGKEFDG